MIDSYNVLIVGGGPAGITAGIYSKYDGNNPLILEEKTLAWIPENHVNLLDKLEGFPGLLNTVNGTELVDRFKYSLSEMGVEYKEHVRVLSIKRHGANFILKTDSSEYLTKAVILATGTLPVQLPKVLIKGFEDDIYYFALNNYEKYIGKHVVVLGSRNSGSTAAIYLARHGVKVTIVEIKALVQAKEKHTKYFKDLEIKTITNAKITALKGEGYLAQLSYEIYGKVSEIECSALFCYIGVRPNIELAKSLDIQLDENEYAITDFYQTTGLKGVFVAGDMCGDLKHIVAASGQGAKAAYNVNKYLTTIHKSEE